VYFHRTRSVFLSGFVLAAGLYDAFIYINRIDELPAVIMSNTGSRNQTIEDHLCFFGIVLFMYSDIDLVQPIYGRCLLPGSNNGFLQTEEYSSQRGKELHSNG